MKRILLSFLIGAFVLIGVCTTCTAAIVIFSDGEEPSAQPEQPLAPDQTTATTAPISATVIATATRLPSSTPQPAILQDEDCVEPEDSSLTNLLMEMQSCSPSISDETRELIRLYLSLEEFKTDPEFHRVGFAPCCRFSLWLDEVEAFRDGAGSASYTEVGLLPGELLQIGLEYVGNAGQPTEVTEFFMRHMEFTTRQTMGLEKPALLTPVDEFLGEWIYGDSTSALSFRMRIFSDAAGQPYVTFEYEDGSTRTRSLRETESPIGRRFDDAEIGEYYVVDAQGDLEIWDSYGFVDIARKTE